MCIRDSSKTDLQPALIGVKLLNRDCDNAVGGSIVGLKQQAVSYTHLRAHETVLDLVCRLLLEKKTKEYVSQIQTQYFIKRYSYNYHTYYHLLPRLTL